MILERVRGLVIDLDGCVYVGDKLVEGAAEAIKQLRRIGVGIVFLTNNSTLTRRQYVEKLSRMGVEAYFEEVLTSGVVAARFIASRQPGSRCLAVAEDGFTLEAQPLGLRIIDPSEWRRADYVVVGLDRRLSYEKLAKAALAIRAGAFFLATNLDNVYPSEDGFQPGAGSIAALLSTATGVQPYSVGKPSKEMSTQALELLRLPADEVVFVGDRVDTDVAAARAVGCRSILVKTGAYSLFSKGTAEADLVVESIAKVPEVLSVK
ncbi:MAG: HAD-IIA family hydrolase [Candidatus Caldarchaeum sp.]